MPCPPSLPLLQPDLRPAMDYMNNASNSYSPGDAMSSSLANVTLSEQRHQENGVQAGHRSPGDAKMKGQRDGWMRSCFAGVLALSLRGDVTPMRSAFIFPSLRHGGSSSTSPSESCGEHVLRHVSKP